MKVISRFKHCSNVVITTSIIYCELNSSAEMKLEQRWNFDVVTSALLQRCVLVVRRFNITTTFSQSCAFAGMVFFFKNGSFFI